MKSSLCTWLIALALAVVAQPAMSQQIQTPAIPAATDSATALSPNSATPAPIAAIPLAQNEAIGIVGLSASNHGSQTQSQTQPAEGGIKGFFFGTQRRASNTLMIGGVALAGIGEGVVKGEIGAVLAVVGLLSSIGGLYLAF